ncbi:CPBP family intramembrane metalloprotease [Leucothrix sargassi]|nr:CPBP family intramembrane metalloprotease [Leucothrix sargassi]
MSESSSATRSQIPVWQTIVITLVTLIVFLFSQIVVLEHYTDSQLANYPDMERDALRSMLASGATAISWMTIVTSIVATSFLLLMVYLRGLSIKQYLGIQPFSKRDLINWQIVMLGFIAFTSFFAYVISHQPSEFMIKLWESTDNIVLLLIAVVIAAPIFEETLFRGFMFSGIQRSYLGTGVAIGFSAASWAVIHTQYQAFDLITIFFFGILLAMARIASQSLLLPITLHATFNFFGVLEMAIFN